MRPPQEMLSPRTGFFFLFLFFILLRSIYPSTVQAEILVPLHIEKGANLIHIARDFCSQPSDWKTIAAVNNLKTPYLILENSTLQIPLSILRTEDVSALVASINGSPKLVKSDSTIIALQKGDLILPGQTVVTGKGEHIHLIYPDHKHTRIDSQSTMTLVYLMRLADGSLKASFSLEKGRITHSVLQKLKANETFETRTAIAITGIRGTEFRFKVADDANNIVETLKGKVVIASAGKQIVLNKGMGSRVKKDQAPKHPVSLPATVDTPAMKDIYRLLPVIMPAPEHKTAKYIHLRLTLDSLGQNTVLEQTANPGGEFTLLNLNDGSYYVRLTAVDDKGFESLPNAPSILSLRTTPTAPLVTSPQNGSQTFDSRITISWSQSDLATLYKIQLATDSGFSRIIDEQQLAAGSYTTPELSPGSYFFRVKLIAKDSFETLYSLPLHWKVLESPALGGGGLINQEDNGITLRWPALPNIAWYRIQVAKDQQFNKILFSADRLGNPSYFIEENLAPGTYYLRIAATTEGGQTSPWSSSQKMIIDATSPGLLHYIIAIGIAALFIL